MTISFEPGIVAEKDFIPLCVPFVSGNEWKYIKDCLDSNWVSSAGPYVDRFEQEMADKIGLPFAVAVTNGTAALIAEKIQAEQFLNATDVDGVYDMDPNKFKKAKKFKQIEMKNLKNMLVHEDSIAGGYDLMDIVALKIIERSKIKTRILKADIKIIEKAIKGSDVGTEIILPSK